MEGWAGDGSGVREVGRQEVGVTDYWLIVYWLSIGGGGRGERVRFVKEK